MIRGRIHFLIILFILFVPGVLIDFASTTKNKLQQQNNTPVVKIIAPKNNSRFGWNTQVNYSITVSDKEDGESKYEEINPKEVLLEVKYIGDESKIPRALNKRVVNDPQGLASVITSNCFNCHAFNSKSIGPSFYNIKKKYKTTPENIALLVKHTREGSTSIWGKASMPTHTELTKEETKKIVEWILKNASSNLSYYVGTEGSFRPQAGVVSQREVAYLLTASYTDHGVKDTPNQRLKGQDVIVIHCK
ncbi:MAG: c-type cytochrome [Ginsengibacter sp.]